MQTVRYTHFPADLAVVHLALFANVDNALNLRARIVQAATALGEDADAEREALCFAFVDARLICSLLHLQTAVYQAILAHTQGALRTKTVHSEVLWALNPSNNISEAIRRYGVSDTSTALFVVRITSPELDNVLDRMQDVVSGDLSPISALSDITDWSSIKKYHKLNGEPAVKAAQLDPARERAVVTEIVVSSVAMKSVMQ